MMKLNHGSMKNCLMIFLLFCIMLLSTGCVKTVYKTDIKYVIPEIPESIIEPCSQIESSFTTNGELLMSYLTLQTSYLECSAKVRSIYTIIQSYKDIYGSESNELP